MAAGRQEGRKAGDDVKARRLKFRVSWRLN